MITGTLAGGQITFRPPSGMVLQASVALVDDALGELGQRQILVTDPGVKAQVEAFLAQMLPSLSETAGFAISLPTPAPVDDAPVIR